MSPLSGIRVLDLSSIIFGPLASQILASYGAEVIKIESPAGDSTRTTGPATEKGMAAIFLGANHSKQSVVLDLKRVEAQEALQAMMDKADVLMHSMRPQKLAALQLSTERVREKYPRLVFASLLGFLPGPYQGRPAYDDVIQSMSATADLMLRQGGEPRYFPTIAADKTCAHVAAHAILAALIQRGKTGQGCLVEIPMFESMVSFNLVEHFYGQHFDPALAPAGYPRVLAPWRRPYRTSDSFVAMMPYTDHHWRQLFDALGHANYAQDPRFINMSARTDNIAALYQLLSEWVASQSTEYWLALCDRLEIPAAPVHDLDHLIQDPHLLATGFFETIQDDKMGTLRFPGSPVRFDGRKKNVATPPRLGEHTVAMLKDAGLSEARIQTLLQTGAAVASETPSPSPSPSSTPTLT